MRYAPLLIALGLVLLAAQADARISATEKLIIFGATSSASGSSAPVGCAGTGFDFTLSCNSQYLSVF